MEMDHKKNSVKISEKKKGEVSIKHSAYTFLKENTAPVPSCNQCLFKSECPSYKADQTQCVAILEMQKEMTEEINSLSHIQPKDQYLVDRFVKNYCFLTIVDKWLSQVGPFRASDDGMNIQPIVNTKLAYERLVQKQASGLGIGPQARARLNLTNVQSFCFAKALQDTND